METRTLISKGNNREFDFNATAGTISFRVDITQERIMIITNLSQSPTSNTFIYNFGCTGFGGTLSSNLLTLEFDTSAMSSTDELMVVIEDNNQKKVETLLLDNNLTIDALNEMLTGINEISKTLKKIYSPN